MEISEGVALGLPPHEAVRCADAARCAALALARQPTILARNCRLVLVFLTLTVDCLRVGLE